MNRLRPTSTLENRQLVERLIARDTGALGELYDQMGGLVYSMVLRVARDPGAAENLTQDVFLRVWHRIPSFDMERSSLVKWVLMMARCAAIDFWRSRSATQGRATISMDDPGCRTAFHETGAKAVRSHVQAEEIRAALARLQPQQRHLLELAYFDGLSQTEMAHHLELPLGTVKTRVRSALRQLRDHLARTAPLGRIGSKCLSKRTSPLGTPIPQLIGAQ